FVIAHRLAPLAKRLERLHAGLEVVPFAVAVHLEVEGVVIEDSDEPALDVEAHAAKHRTGHDGLHHPDLFTDIVPIPWRDSHGSLRIQVAVVRSNSSSSLTAVSQVPKA